MCHVTCTVVWYQLAWNPHDICVVGSLNTAVNAEPVVIRKYLKGRFEYGARVFSSWGRLENDICSHIITQSNRVKTGRATKGSLVRTFT